MSTTKIYSRRSSPYPKRVVEVTRPKYTAEGVPSITPLLVKLGLRAWCINSEPEVDCTGNLRLDGQNGRFKLRDPTKPEKIRNQELALHRRTLQKIAFELYEHYPELRLFDIGFIMGYSAVSVAHFMKWEPPEGY